MAESRERGESMRREAPHGFCGGSGKEHAKGKVCDASRREVDALSRPFGVPSPAKRGRGSLPEQGDREGLSVVRIY